VRAIERTLYAPDRRLFDDPIASRLIRGRARLLMHTAPLLRLLMWINARLYHGMVYEVLARARYAQEQLERLAATGCRQVCILGAGFDGTAWRQDLPADLRVFEVDHPATQELKRRLLVESGVPIPGRVAFVPFELGREGLVEALEAAGCAPVRPTFATLLGVLPYMKRREVEATCRDLSRAFRSGSEVVYTYLSRSVLDPKRRSPSARRVARRLERMGEPLVFAEDPEEMAALVRGAGWTQVESLDGGQMTARYFAARGDRRVVAEGVNLARAVL
jgi:methyltransferase (TIGR00027 family)